MWGDPLADAGQTVLGWIVAKEPLAVVRDEARADLDLLEPARRLAATIEVNFLHFVAQVVREALKLECGASANDEGNAEKILQREDDLFPAQLLTRPTEEFARRAL